MDLRKTATDPQFGDVYKKFQTQYGEKPVHAREIKKSLGKDDFLRIMIAQMKNQDPTSPFKAEQMAAEVAQFTTVEQLQNVNQSLSKMSTQNKPVEQMAMTHLIGKTVTIDRQRFPHTQNQTEFLSFNLPKKAQDVNLVILNEAGEEIFKNEMGSQKEGEVSLSWDGIQINGLPSKTGIYMMRIDAKDDGGIPIEINRVGQAKIIGVSFEGNEPVFLVGNAAKQEKVTMKNIIRVELDQEAQPKALDQNKNIPSSSGIQPVNNSNLNKNNFISFQNGLGSGNLEDVESLEKVNQIVQQKLEKPLEMNSIQKSQDQEKGFPNGLTDSSEEVRLNE